MTLRVASACLVLLFFVHVARPADINALTSADLHAAFRNAKPGDHINSAPVRGKGHTAYQIPSAHPLPPS